MIGGTSIPPCCLRIILRHSPRRRDEHCMVRWRAAQEGRLGSAVEQAAHLRAFVHRAEVWTRLHPHFKEAFADKGALRAEPRARTGEGQQRGCVAERGREHRGARRSRARSHAAVVMTIVSVPTISSQCFATTRISAERSCGIVRSAAQRKRYLKPTNAPAQTFVTY